MQRKQLMTPRAVRFGEAVEEDQHGGIFGAHVDDVEFDPGRKLDALLFEIADHRIAPSGFIGFFSKPIWRGLAGLASGHRPGAS